jgi:hydrogenase-4 component E
VSTGLYPQLLDLACGAFLIAAVLVLWLRELAAIVRVFAVQGVTLGAIGLLLGASEHRWDLVGIAVGVAVLRAGVLPYLMRRSLTSAGQTRETQPLVNVTASLLTAAALTLLAYAAARPLVALNPTPATRALPVGLAVVLIGFFTLVTRRRAISQVVGFLLLDNGITAVAFLATAGVPLIVELGVAFDLLLAVLVLQLLTLRIRTAFGDTDIDDLRELHD